RMLGQRMIAVVDAGRDAAERLHRRREATLELVVVVAVEDIVLAVVLVVDHSVGRFQALDEGIACRGACLPGAVAETSPGEEGVGKVLARLPEALVEGNLNPGAVGARRRAEYAGAGQPRRVRDALRRQARCGRAHRSGNRIRLVVLVERGNGTDRRIHEVDLVGDRVTAMRGRRRSLSGMMRKPVTRPVPRSQTGSAPISASTSAISSPPVRMFDVPHADMAIERGHSPASSK